MLIKMVVIEMVMIKVLHSWKNAQTAQTRLCAIFQVCCAIFCQCKYCFFVFFFENWHKIWMKRHRISLMGGQTCFLMVF